MRGAPVRLSRHGGLQGPAAEERGAGEDDEEEKAGEKRKALLRRLEKRKNTDG